MANRHRPRGTWSDRLATLLFSCIALGITTLFLGILVKIVWNGAAQIDIDYLLSAPQDAGRAGGIGSILVSTGLILAVCLAVSVPLGLGSAMLLAELCLANGRFGCAVRGSLDLLAGVPSIVIGLFGNAFFCVTLGLGFSILSGGLTLSCMVLPILIRATEEGFRAVPDEIRLGGAALGLSRGAVLRRLLLPLALPGLLVGLVLGVGRALAETAALIFTSGYVDRMPSSLLDSGRSLSIHIYDLSMNVPGGDQRAYAAALMLIVSLVLINRIASWASRRALSQGIVNR